MRRPAGVMFLGVQMGAVRMWTVVWVMVSIPPRRLMIWARRWASAASVGSVGIRSIWTMCFCGTPGMPVPGASRPGGMGFFGLSASGRWWVSGAAGIDDAEG